VPYGITQLVSELEFNVPFQHKYGYIRDEGSHSRGDIPAFTTAEAVIENCGQDRTS